MRQPIVRKTMNYKIQPVGDRVTNRASAFMNGDFDDISNQTTAGDFKGFEGTMAGHGQMGDFWSDLRDKVLGNVKTVVAGAVAPTTTAPTTTVAKDNTMKYVMIGGGVIVSIALLLFIMKKMSKPQRA